LSGVSNIKNGDEFVFQQVFEEYHEKLYHYTLSKTRSEYLAEEVTQITFIKLWKNRERLDESLSVSIQLFRIAKTTLIDLLRKQHNFAALIKGLNWEDKDKDDNINAGIDYNETNRKLLQAISQLPPMRKKVFEMNRLQGMPYKEIAAQLSISTKTVEKHISKAISQLRPYMQFLLIGGGLAVLIKLMWSVRG
jgi:RNA polymerase sigma-70 factor (family 1)